jgi:hypothetical protein
VLASSSAQEELARLGFAVFRADWTLRDARIADELARLGRAGVPVYALYPAGQPDAPRLLPDLLSLDAFTAALRGDGVGQRDTRVRSCRLLAVTALTRTSGRRSDAHTRCDGKERR